MPPLTFFSRNSSIHSLPVELLSRIFILGAAQDSPYSTSPFLLKPDQHYYAVPSTNFQVLVSQICHHWRQIALRTPSLWATLYFREPSHIPRAIAYLERCCSSGAYLLDILVDTVALEDYIPGINLCRKEIRDIFTIIMPHVKRWRAFHLKIRDNDCKGQARVHLGSCGGAPNLETLQLYHFEDFRTSQNLYLATYRPPVVVFGNDLPRLKNVSLIGVNLPWDRSPYLSNLRNLELALHPNIIRPTYDLWERMLRSPELHTLSVHYSGPKVANDEPEYIWPGIQTRIRMETLQVLILTDLDPDYLCRLMERLYMPAVSKLSLNLPEQDYTPFVQLLVGNGGREASVASPIDSASPTNTALSPSHHSLPFPGSHTPSVDSSVEPLSHLPILCLEKIEVLVITALECSIDIWRALLRALVGVKVLKVDFTRVNEGFWKVLAGEGEQDNIDSDLHQVLDDSGHVETTSDCDGTIDETTTQRNLRLKRNLLLPNLHTMQTSGLSGETIVSIIKHRGKFTEVTCGVNRWMVKWSERLKGADAVLDGLVSAGFCPLPYGRSSGRFEGRGIKFEPFEEEEEEEEEEEGEEAEVEDPDEVEQVVVAQANGIYSQMEVEGEEEADDWDENDEDVE